MPRFNRSSRVKKRIRILLKKLLEHTEVTSVELPFFEYSWTDKATDRPRLTVKTTLDVLTELIASESTEPVTKEHTREVLKVLKDDLKILLDHRLKKQGARTWDFTITFWGTSIAKNLRKFDALWEENKANQTGRTKPKSAVGDNAQLLLAQQTSQDAPLNNLKIRTDGSFIDSQDDLNALLSLLNWQHNPGDIVAIVGPGGIGKTTLALEAARLCLEAAQNAARVSTATASEPIIPIFEAIIVASAQKQTFVGPHLSRRVRQERNLRDILREIVRTLDRAEGMPRGLIEQIGYIQRILREYKTLLILDNLETVENLNGLLQFLLELPKTVKVLVTSRIRLGFGKAIELDYLTSKPGQLFIEQQSREKLVKCDRTQIKDIYKLSGGLPLAMTYIIGYLSVYNQLPQLERAHIAQAPHELARYCAEASLKRLQDKLAYRLLLAATLFVDKIPIKAAAYIVAKPSQVEDIQQKFKQLYRLSLVNKIDENVYSMHSLTRDYVSAKLDDEPEFKHQAQTQWVDWYLKEIATFADDWQDWQDYDSLQQDWSNIRAVVEWCIDQGHYQQVWQAWQGLRGYTLYRGYWDERIAWMDWLMQEAHSLEDNEGLAKAAYYQGQTLAHINEADASGQALQHFERAWARRQHVSKEFQFEIVSYLIALSLRQERLNETPTWLDQGQRLLDEVSNPQIDYQRQQCHIYYHSAEYWLRQQKYDAAMDFYYQALTLAKATQWQRVIAYIKGWLARLLLAQGNYDQATQLLTESLEAAQTHQDKRSMAQCYLTFAQIAKQRQDRKQLKAWVKLAHQGFEQLGMLKEAKEVKALLKET